MKAYIKNREVSNNLALHFKELEKGQTKPNQQKERVMKIRRQTNEIETEKPQKGSMKLSCKDKQN